MRKITFLFTVWISQFIFGQEDYSKYKPIEPLYNNGGLDKFYEYLSNNIDFTKVENEKDVIIGFVLGKDGKMNHIKVSFCSTEEAEKEITLVLQKADKWDLSNQKNKEYFICYKMKLFFSEKTVKGLSKTIELKDDVVDIDMDKNEFANSDVKINSVEDNVLYNSAGLDVIPEYPGGIAEFYLYLQKNYKVPNVKGLGGKIAVSFVIEKDGSITDIKVLRDIGHGTGEEAIRVLQNCKKWQPAEQNGAKVRCSYMLPIKL
jgi:TonB family protein